MAKQSARRDRKNQGFPPCFISTLRVMWFRSANSHTGPQHKKLQQEAGQMAASDYVPKLSKYRLHPMGRPQMESGHSNELAGMTAMRPNFGHSSGRDLFPKADFRSAGAGGSFTPDGHSQTFETLLRADGLFCRQSRRNN